MENIIICSVFNGLAIILNIYAIKWIVSSTGWWKSKYYIGLHCTNLFTQLFYLASVAILCTSEGCEAESSDSYYQGGVFFILATFAVLMNFLFIVSLNSYLLEIFVQLDTRTLSTRTASRIKFVLLPLVSLGVIFPFIYSVQYLFFPNSRSATIDDVAIISNLYAALICLFYDNCCSVFLARLIFNAKKNSAIYAKYRELLSLIAAQIILDWLGMGLYAYASVFAKTLSTYYGIVGVSIASIALHIFILRIIVTRLSNMISTAKSLSIASQVQTEAFDFTSEVKH